MKYLIRLPFASACGLVLTLCLPALAQAATLNVPSSSYPTIQSAVNAASNGDTVLIADGTYTGPGNRDIDFGGKNITVTSQHGAASTVINCQGSSTANHRGFLLHNYETNATISGLTIENGYETPNSAVYTDGSGAGIYLNSVSANISNCIIRDNTVGGGDGGGIFSNCNFNTIVISNCTLIGNTAASGIGGGIFDTNSSGSTTGGGTTKIVSCTFTNNAVTNGLGGGIYNINGAEGVAITNCAFNGNSSTGNGSGGGGIWNENFGGPITVTNCTLTGNTCTSGGNLETYDSGGTTSITNTLCYGDSSGEVVNDSSDISSLTVNNCDIQSGYTGTGNIDADPKFVSTTDFHLQSSSPCLGAGTASGAPATTLDGQTRPNPPSIGAYEMVQPVIPPISTTHVLWDNTNGAASIWNYDTSGGTFTQNTYGPYPNWTAIAVADGGTDGKTRVLWDNTDGTASLWSLNNTTAQLTQYSFGPYAGWTAKALSVGMDNTTHVLWTNTDGAASVWNYQTSSGTFTQNTYGPYSGWTATAMADGPDGKTRLVWDKTDGTASIWSLDNGAGTFSQFSFGPYTHWTAAAVSVGTDNTTHVLWDNTDGTASVWNYSTASGTLTQNTYGPYSGWTAKGLADGSDGKVRVLWDNANGTLSLWSLDNTTGVFSQFSFGPYGGWTAGSVSGT